MHQSICHNETCWLVPNFRRDFRLAIADPSNPDGFRPQPVVWKSDAVKKKVRFNNTGNIGILIHTTTITTTNNNIQK